MQKEGAGADGGVVGATGVFVGAMGGSVGATGGSDTGDIVARVLLNAIFEANLIGNGSRTRNNDTPNNDTRNNDTRNNENRYNNAGGQERDRHRDRNGNGGENNLARQYAESQAHQGIGTNVDQRNNNTNIHRRHPNNADDNVGIYVHEGGGMLIIDDDANPGLRGGEYDLAMQGYDHRMQHAHNDRSTTRSNPRWTARDRPTTGHASTDQREEDAPSTNAGSTTTGDEESNRNTLWTSKNILTRHCHAARVRADNFPTLPTTTAAAPPKVESRGHTSSSAQHQHQHQDTSTSAAAPVRGMSNSLVKIGNMVQKLSAKQIDKQRKAREIALQRAMLSQANGFDQSSGMQWSQHAVTERRPVDNQ